MNFNWKEFPILGAILKILSNEGIIIAVVSTITATYLNSHQYDNLIVYLVFAAGYFIAGTWHLADVRKGLIKHKAEIEALAKEALHVKLDIPIGGKIITLDLPDEIEPLLVKEIVNGLLGE